VTSSPNIFMAPSQ
jgi:hypothetical protein